MTTKNFKKSVNEIGQQIFAFIGEDSIYRVYEDEDGDKFAKIGDEYESLKWFEQQRYKVTLWVDSELEALYDKKGL